ANRYDLHPIVRSVVWQALDIGARQGIYDTLYSYFDAMPRLSWYEVKRLEDLTPGIELFHTLIKLERYQDALLVFQDYLAVAMRMGLSANRQHAELLEQLFPDGMETLPRLASVRSQSCTLHELALSYKCNGEPSRAESRLRRAIAMDEREKDGANATV